VFTTTLTLEVNAACRRSTVRVHLELPLGLATRSNNNRKPWIEHYVHHRNSGEVVLLSRSIQEACVSGRMQIGPLSFQ
jgi:hypothetical protein